MSKACRLTPMRPARHLSAVRDAFGKWEAPVLGLLAILVGTDAALRDGIEAAPIAFAILLAGLAIWAFRGRGKGGRIAAIIVFFGGVAFFTAAESPPPVPASRYVYAAVFWVAGAVAGFVTWRRNQDGGGAK